MTKFGLQLNLLPMINHQTFFGLNGNDLVEVINYAFENEKLTLTMCRGVIVLIWKGNEKEYLKRGYLFHY